MLRQWGANISLPPPLAGGGGEGEALEKWFFSDAQSLIISEWRYVCCICIAPSTLEYRFVLDEEDPYQRCYYLFYSRRELTRTLQVWGGICWEQMVRLKGRVDLVQHLQHSRAFPVPNVLCYPPPPRPPQGGGELWLPIHLPRSCNVELPTVQLDEIMQQLERCLSGNLLDNSAAAAAAVFCAFSGLIVLALEEDAQRRFHADRMHFAQHWLLQQALPQFAVTEAETVQLLIDNGLGVYMENAMLLQATAKDRRFFLQRWPNDLPPDFVLRVPMEEMHHAAPGDFPLYPYGLYHITYKDVPQWLWNAFCLQNQRLMNSPAPAGGGREVDPRAVDAAQMVRAHYAKHPAAAARAPPPRRGGGKPVAATGGASFQGDTFDLDPAQIAQLALPPCIAAIVRAPQFPPDQVRPQLLKVLQRAGLSDQSIANWFEAQNDAYPRTNAPTRDAKARWNYEYALTSEFKGPVCETIVAERASAGGVRCPFAKTSGSSGDIEELTESCKKSCAPAETKAWSGPHNLIRRALYRSRSK